MARHPTTERATDAELLRAARQDSGAFRTLYDRHAVRIHAFHLKRSRDAGAAMELTAETFAQAWLSREAYRDHEAGTAAPWLFGIARHVLASSVRQHRIERVAQDRLAVGLAHLATTAVDESWLDGLDDDLAAALASLPDGQRRAIELRVLADQGYEDVAHVLGCTPDTARVRVHRGLTSIRRRLAATTGD